METFLWLMLIVAIGFNIMQAIIVTHIRKAEIIKPYEPSNQMIIHLEAELEMKSELRQRLSECQEANQKLQEFNEKLIGYNKGWQQENKELTLKLASSEEALHSAMNEIEKS